MPEPFAPSFAPGLIQPMMRDRFWHPRLAAGWDFLGLGRDLSGRGHHLTINGASFVGPGANLLRYNFRYNESPWMATGSHVHQNGALWEEAPELGHKYLIQTLGHIPVAGRTFSVEFGVFQWSGERGLQIRVRTASTGDNRFQANFHLGNGEVRETTTHGDVTLISASAEKPDEFGPTYCRLTGSFGASVATGDVLMVQLLMAEEDGGWAQAYEGEQPPAPGNSLLLSPGQVVEGDELLPRPVVDRNEVRAVPGGSSRPGKLVLHFDGVDDIATAQAHPDFSGWDDFTVAFWINPADQPSGPGVDILAVDPREEDARAWRVSRRLNQGSYEMRLVTDGWYMPPLEGAEIPFAMVPTNTWHHMAWTRRGEVLTSYLNGEAVGSDTFAGTLFSSAADLTIGGGPEGSLHGMLSDIVLMRTALAEADIRRLYHGLQPLEIA